jgi:DNA mismatch repair ATPase MutL
MSIRRLPETVVNRIAAGPGRVAANQTTTSPAAMGQVAQP